MATRQRRDDFGRGPGAGSDGVAGSEQGTGESAGTRIVSIRLQGQVELSQIDGEGMDSIFDQEPKEGEDHAGRERDFRENRGSSWKRDGFAGGF